MYDSHGVFDVSATENKQILKVDALGPFNPQAVDDYDRQIREFLPVLEGVWGQFSVINQNCLYTPQAELKLKELTALKSQNGLKFVAILFVDCLCEIVLEEKIKAFYQAQAIECQIFTSEDSAMHWLTNQLKAV